MKVIKSMWITPKDGEDYGFPKLFTPEVDGDVVQWLCAQGYPVRKITINTTLRMTNIVYHNDGMGLGGNVK